jgi:hypothetical protein
MSSSGKKNYVSLQKIPSQPNEEYKLQPKELLDASYANKEDNLSQL